MVGVREVAEWARKHLGVHWDPSAESEIRLKLVLAAQAEGFEDVEGFVRHVLNELTPADRRRILASVFTVGETYFFREPAVLETFKAEILPKILGYREECGQSRLYLWSAGCSTGEEAYTLAMILKEALRERPGWDFSVLATDINEKALETARQGLYRPWSFRKPLPMAYSKYLVRQGEENLWRVHDDIKRHTTFSVLNLAADAYPSLWTKTTDVDAIFCRNVLMYFDPKTRTEVLRRFSGALNKAGWLVLSASEIHTASSDSWDSVRYPGAIFLRKRHGEASAIAKAYAFAKMQVPKNVVPESGGESAPASAGGRASVPAIGSSRQFFGGNEKGRRPSCGANGIPDPKGASAEPLGGKIFLAPGVSSEASPEGGSLEEEISRLLSAGRLDEAAVRVEQCLMSEAAGALGRHLRHAVRCVVQALAAESRSEKALDVLNRVLGVDKFDPAYHHMKGALHAERGEIEEAVAAFRQMLYVAPQSATALLSLGMLCLRDGHGEAARRYLEGALKLLHGKSDQEIVPYSEGMSVGQMRRVIEQFLGGMGERM